MFFWKFENKILLKLVGSFVNNMEKNQYEKKEHNQQFSVQKVMITFILFKSHRMIHNSIDFCLFILSWKGS